MLLQSWSQVRFLSKVRMLSKYWPIKRSVFAEMLCMAGNGGMCVPSLSDNRQLFHTNRLPTPIACTLRGILAHLQYHSLGSDLLSYHCSFLPLVSSAPNAWVPLCYFDLSHAIPLCKQSLWFPRMASGFLSLVFIIFHNQSHQAHRPQLTHSLWTSWWSYSSGLEREEEMAGIPSPESFGTCLLWLQFPEAEAQKAKGSGCRVRRFHYPLAR